MQPYSQPLSPRSSASGLRVLVTGASGYIGQALVPRLLAEGWTVRAAARDIDRLDARALERAATVAAGCEVGGRVEVASLGDLAARSDFAPLLDGVSHVVHLAGIAHATAAISEATYQAVNARAPARLAEACRAAGVQRLVHLSSVRAQSGPVAARVLRETDRPEPSDAYGRSKLVGDRLIETVLAEGATDFTILRPVLVVGPGAKGNLAALLRLARLPIPLPLGACSARRSLIGLSGLTAIIAHVLRADSAARRVLLAADEPALSAGEIVRIARVAHGRPARLIAVPPRILSAIGGLIGQGELVARLTGGLEVDTTALRQTGYRSADRIETAIADWARAGAA